MSSINPNGGFFSMSTPLEGTSINSAYQEDLDALPLTNWLKEMNLDTVQQPPLADTAENVNLPTGELSFELSENRPLTSWLKKMNLDTVEQLPNAVTAEIVNPDEVKDFFFNSRDADGSPATSAFTQFTTQTTTAEASVPKEGLSQETVDKILAELNNYKKKYQKKDYTKIAFLTNCTVEQVKEADSYSVKIPRLSVNLKGVVDKGKFDISGILKNCPNISKKRIKAMQRFNDSQFWGNQKPRKRDS